MVAGITARGVHVFNGRCPGRGRVADVALLGGDEVAGILAGGGCAIVASRTRTADPRMIEMRGYPCRGGVAGIALRRGDDVRGVLTGGGRAVVAAGA